MSLPTRANLHTPSTEPVSGNYYLGYAFDDTASRVIAGIKLFDIRDWADSPMAPVRSPYTNTFTSTDVLAAAGYIAENMSGDLSEADALATDVLTRPLLHAQASTNLIGELVERNQAEARARLGTKPARAEMPLLTDPHTPFWLARPDVEGESRIVFKSAMRHDTDPRNAFSAIDILRAAGCEVSPLLTNQQATAEALKLGVDHAQTIGALQALLAVKPA